jgi:hypothetical protein
VSRAEEKAAYLGMKPWDDTLPIHVSVKSSRRRQEVPDLTCNGVVDGGFTFVLGFALVWGFSMVAVQEATLRICSGCHIETLIDKIEAENG